MHFFLGYDEDETFQDLDRGLNRTLPFKPPNAYAPVSGGQATKINHETIPYPGQVLQPGPLELSLVYTTDEGVSGQGRHLSIQPTLWIVPSDKNQSEKEIWIGEELSTALNPRRMDFSGDITKGYDLRNHRLKLVLTLRNVTGSENATITFSKSESTYLSVEVGAGAYENHYAYSSVYFKHFQKRVRGLIRSEVHVYERVSKNILSSVHSTEEIEGGLFTDVNVFASERGNLASSVSVVKPEDLADPFTDVIVDGRALLGGGELYDRPTLHDVAQELTDLPEVYAPPAVPTLTNDQVVIEHLAHQIVAVAEDYRLHDDVVNEGSYARSVGGLLYAFSPSAGHGGTVAYNAPAREWRLPEPFSGEYFIPFVATPEFFDGDKKVVPERASSMWLVVRHRDVGANLNAVLGEDGRQGELVYNRPVSSTDRTMVWLFRNVRQYTTYLKIRSTVPEPPGFAGQNAALVIVP